MLTFEAKTQDWVSIIMFKAEVLDYGSNLNF
jgi:hypothetical protein